MPYIPLTNIPIQIQDTVTSLNMSGGSLEFYRTGTSTPTNLFSDDSGTSIGTSISLNSGGLPESGGNVVALYYDSDIAVDIAVKNASNVEISPRIAVQSPASWLTASQVGNLLFPQSSEELSASVTPTNVQYPVGDLRRYGALIDGTTDDASALSNWLDVGMQGVGLVHPGGNCKVTTWTQKDIASDLIVVGLSDAEITGETSVDFIKPLGGRIRFVNVEFDTWSSVGSNVVADTGTVDSLEFIDLILRNCSDHGITLERPINRFVLQNVQMFGMSNYAVEVGRNIYAEQDNWKNFVIDNVYIEDVTATGATDAAGVILYGKDLQVSNLHIGTATSDTGSCWGLYTKVRYAQISNIIVDSIVSNATDAIGVNVKGSRKGQTASPQGFTYIIDGVTVKSSAGIGLKIQQQDVFASNIHIEEFDIDGITVDEIDSPNVAIDGFKILTATGTSKVGIRVSNDAGGIKVVNGLIDGPDDGVRLAGSGGGGVSYGFASIDVDNCLRGFHINTNATLDRVKLRDITAKSGCTTGLQTSGTGAVTNLEVVDSDFAAATTPVSLGGTLTTPKLRKVRGYVTENAGLATVSSGGTIAHGLAGTPDAITLTAGETGLTDLTVSSPTTTTFVATFGGGGGSDSIYWRASMDEAL